MEYGNVAMVFVFGLYSCRLHSDGVGCGTEFIITEK